MSQDSCPDKFINLKTNVPMISEVIKNRMEVVGYTQAQLASSIGCTPTQLGLFLKGKASLNREALDKCFDILGIPFNNISKRIELAKEVAQKFHIDQIEEVLKMDRSTMIKKTGCKELMALPEVSKEEFEIMITSGIGDYEATYQYFKTLVLHFIKMPDGSSRKKADASLSYLAMLLMGGPIFPLVGLGISAISAAIGAFALANKRFSQSINNAWGSLTTLTLNSFK